MKHFLLLTLLAVAISGHVTYPGPGSPYGGQQGLFIPQIHKVQNISSADDVVYTRFCKAICMLYVPIEMTCGLNNEVYLNDCQARCDRVSTDSSRLMFNNKCCCSPGSEYIDSAWANNSNTPASTDPSIKSSSFCVSVAATTALTGGGKINVFAIPPCLVECLGIDDKGDLKFVDTTKTYFNECDDALGP